MKSGQLSYVFSLLALCLVAKAQAQPIDSWGSALVDFQIGDYFDIAAAGPQSEASLFFDDEHGHVAIARSYADYGRNHVYAAATNTGEQSTPTYAEAISVWNERFLIGGGSGLGRASVDVHLDGDIEVHGANAFAPLLSYELYYVPEAGATFVQFPILWNSSSELAGGVGRITPRSLTAEFTFEYDQPFVLYGSLRALVAGNATIDVYHSARINSIAFPSGALVSNDGGAPARAALRVNGVVAEPSSLATTLVALLFVLAPALRRLRR